MTKTILTRADLDEAAQVIDKLTGIEITSVSVDPESVHLELDSDSAISDATVIASRMGLPVASVGPGFTEWCGSLPSGGDITVTAYGEPNIAINSARRPWRSYRVAPGFLLAASAAAGSALTAIVIRRGGTQ